MVQKGIVPSKRPCIIQEIQFKHRRRKAQEKKLLAEHKKKITEFFNSTPIEESEDDTPVINEPNLKFCHVIIYITIEIWPPLIM